MKHKHAELIKAWADGEIIQFYEKEKDKWLDCLYPSWVIEVKYRIKPEPKADVVRYIGCFNFGNTFGDSAEDYHSIRFWDNKIKLTFEGETGKLMKAEVL